MRRLILAGGGHAHLAVLHALARRRLPDVEVVLATPNVHSIYSGMVPGWMAGHYSPDSCLLDVQALAAAGNIRFLEQAVLGVDADERKVQLADGSRLDYEVLSIDVGSETNASWLEALGDRLVTVRPIDRFAQAWVRIVAEAAARPGYRLVIVGGGAAGIELAFAARHAFERQRIDAAVELVTSERGPLPGHEGAARLASDWLRRRGIPVYLARAAGTKTGLLLQNGRVLEADCVIAASGPRAPGWLKFSGLACDEDGYVKVDETHRSVSHPAVFASGDACARAEPEFGRSGVHAVRAGPVVAHNLRAAIEGAAFRRYRPRRRTLYLLATGPRHAIASWGDFGFAGGWVWRLKDAIDRRFIRVNTPPVANVRDVSPG